MGSTLVLAAEFSMSTELFAVVVSLISGAIASVISLIMNFVLRRQEQHKAYSQIVTNDRIGWIKTMRELTAKLLAFCESKDTLNQAELEEFNLIKNRMKIHLNVKYENEKRICEILALPFEEVKSHADELMQTFMEMFNNEWHKVQEEAGQDRTMRRRAAKIYKKN